jgi:phosphoenolpyruvate carboxykinase (GTP)
MAMLPFCGYNMADYFRHWLRMGTRSDEAPSIFHVNWFRTGPDGAFLWPGFGENLRVLRWILERCRGEAEAVRTPVGLVPPPEALDLAGLDLPRPSLEAALRVDRDEWRAELRDMETFFRRFGDRLPPELWDEHRRLAVRLEEGIA